MVSAPEAKEVATDQAPSSPRISFSADLLDDTDNFISISPGGHVDKDDDNKHKAKTVDHFEFLSVSEQRMLSADELFFEGKLLPFWQMQHSEKLSSISLKTKEGDDAGDQTNEEEEEEEKRVSWFLDEDPSPRPPKCTVLWKELLRLKKQRGTAGTMGLSPSSSSSSTSSSSSSLGEAARKEEMRKEEKEKDGKRIKKGLERTRSASMRIRPILHVPLCTPHPKSSALPPLFPLLKKGKVDRPSS